MHSIAELVETTYAEVSPSETGIRAFWKGNIENAANHQKGIEVYSHSQFVTVTRNQIENAGYVFGGIDALDAKTTERLKAICPLIGSGQCISGIQRPLARPQH